MVDILPRSFSVGLPAAAAGEHLRERRPKRIGMITPSSNTVVEPVVAIICTNLPAAWMVEELEVELGKPIFDSTLVTIWHALRLVGFDEPVAGWGRLLRTPVEPGV
jgi:maleate cis-trans isomerase